MNPKSSFKKHYTGKTVSEKSSHFENQLSGPASLFAKLSRNRSFLETIPLIQSFSSDFILPVSPESLDQSLENVDG